MPTFVESPRIVEAAGNKPKRIEEFAGRLSTSQENVSVARMVSPVGWEEPAQQPEFEEITNRAARDVASRIGSGGDRSPRRSSDHYTPRRTRPLQHPRRGRGRVHRCLSPRVLTADSPPTRRSSLTCDAAIDSLHQPAANFRF